MTRGAVIWLLIAGYMSAVFLGFWGTVILLAVVWVAWGFWIGYRTYFDTTLPDQVEEARAVAREAVAREKLVTEAATEYADRLETTPFSISNYHRRLREALNERRRQS